MAPIMAHAQLITRSNTLPSTLTLGPEPPTQANNNNTGLECGNGRLDTNETCDDGNRLEHDGCAGDCRRRDALTPPCALAFFARDMGGVRFLAFVSNDTALLITTQRIVLADALTLGIRRVINGSWTLDFVSGHYYYYEVQPNAEDAVWLLALDNNNNNNKPEIWKLRRGDEWLPQRQMALEFGEGVIITQGIWWSGSWLLVGNQAVHAPTGRGYAVANLTHAITNRVRFVADPTFLMDDGRSFMLQFNDASPNNNKTVTMMWLNTDSNVTTWMDAYGMTSFKHMYRHAASGIVVNALMLRLPPAADQSNEGEGLGDPYFRRTITNFTCGSTPCVLDVPLCYNLLAPSNPYRVIERTTSNTDNVSQRFLRAPPLDLVCDDASVPRVRHLAIHPLSGAIWVVGSNGVVYEIGLSGAQMMLSDDDTRCIPYYYDNHNNRQPVLRLTLVSAGALKTPEETVAHVLTKLKTSGTTGACVRAPVGGVWAYAYECMVTGIDKDPAAALRVFRREYTTAMATNATFYYHLAPPRLVWLSSSSAAKQKAEFENKKEEGASTGMIVGSVLGAALVVVVCLLCCCRRSHSSSSHYYYHYQHQHASSPYHYQPVNTKMLMTPAATMASAMHR
jgi:cysteine-rich repeat protein